MRLRALFRYFYREGIRIKLSKHSKFQGGLHGLVKKHYCNVPTIRPDNYGNRPNRGVYDLDGKQRLRDRMLDGTLDLEDRTALQMLCTNSLSTCCFLQGGQEIYILTWSQVDLDYEVERGDYEGHRVAKINNLIDKTCNLTIRNSYTKDNSVGFYIV